MTDLTTTELAEAVGYQPIALAWPTTNTTPVPIEQFGEDHWSTLAYVESRIVDHQGMLSHDHMRCHGLRHPLMLAMKRTVSGASADGSRYPTRVKGPDGAAADLPDHDDYDCLDDHITAGLLIPVMPHVGPNGWYVSARGRTICDTDNGAIAGDTLITGLVEKILAAYAAWTLTDRGRDIAAQLRAHKADGGSWQAFNPS